MRELIQELRKNKDILGTFYFKGDENHALFTEKYSVPDSRIKRIALVISQTMDALGGGVFEKFFLEGDSKRVSIFHHNGGFCGVVFSNTISCQSIEDIFTEVSSKTRKVEKKAPAKEKLKQQFIDKPKEKVKEKPATKAPQKQEVILDSSVFEKIREILTVYLGDFSDTIFENQMSDMKLDPKAASMSNVQKLCFSLQKASAMLIGPSSAREMVDKLLLTIKDGK